MAVPVKSCPSDDYITKSLHGDPPRVRLPTPDPGSIAAPVVTERDRPIDGPAVQLPHPSSNQILRLLTETGTYDRAGAVSGNSRRIELLPNFRPLANELGGEVFTTLLTILLFADTDERGRFVCPLSAAEIGVLREQSRDTIKRHVRRLKNANVLRVEALRRPGATQFESWRYVIYTYADAPHDAKLQPLHRSASGADSPTGVSPEVQKRTPDRAMANGADSPTELSSETAPPLAGELPTGSEQEERSVVHEASAGQPPQFVAAVDDEESSRQRQEGPSDVGLVAALIRNEVRADVAVRLAHDDPEECRLQLDYLPLRKERGKARGEQIKNPGAYLVAAVEGKYPAPPELKVADARVGSPAEPEVEPEPWRHEAEAAFAALDEAERAARIEIARQAQLAQGGNFNARLGEQATRALAEASALRRLAVELHLTTDEEEAA
jgi:hypothetical protein